MSAPAAEWTASTAFARLVEALDRAGCRVEGTGRQRRAQCPHHPDEKPSLGVTDSASRVLLICRAGCDTVDILADLGLGWGDLFDKTGQRVPPAGGHVDLVARAASWVRPGAYYKYTTRTASCFTSTSGAGAPKEFAFRRPDPSSRSGWRWSLGDCRRVLYRLPELVRRPRGCRRLRHRGRERRRRARRSRGDRNNDRRGGSHRHWRQAVASRVVGGPPRQGRPGGCRPGRAGPRARTSRCGEPGGRRPVHVDR